MFTSSLLMARSILNMFPLKSNGTVTNGIKREWVKKNGENDAFIN